MKIKFNISSILAQLLLLSFVIVWIAPTFGLFISSFRDKDKLAISGWWTSLTTVQVNEIYRTKGKEGQVQEGNYFIIRDNFFNDAKGKKVSYKKMLKTLQKTDILLFGELHNNPITHWLQLETTTDLHTSRQLILGAEMIEADNQIPLDDYLNKKIDAKT